MSFDPRTEYQDVTTAEDYDAKRFTTLAGRVFQWAERRALRRIVRDVPRGSRVLDAPCGTGRLMDLFLERGLRPIGADISGEMIAVARRRVASGPPGAAAFSRMDFLNIPLPDGAVAATFSIRFLVHIPSEERVQMLREFARVSQRSVIMSMSLSTPWQRVRRRLKSWLGHQRPVRHPITARALAEELRRAGLRERRRVWTFPILSEQVLVVCERIP